MRRTLNRREFAFSAALIAVGVSASDAGGATEEELAWLRLGASAELIAAAFCGRAARSRALDRAERRRFADARLADRRHYEQLAVAIGPDVPVETDFSIGFPTGTFASRPRIVEVGLRVKHAIVGLNLGAAAAISEGRLRALAARIAAAEMTHVAYLTSLAGRSALREALPRALEQEQATDRLTPFWDAGA
jgi:ferritin-like protein